MSNKIGYFIRSMLGIENKLNVLEARLGETEKIVADNHRRMQDVSTEQYRKLQQLIYENHIIFTPSSGNAGPHDNQSWVIPLLSGGLGNQLFQISATYALARRTRSQLGLNYDLYNCEGQGSPPALYKNTLYLKIKETNVTPEFTYKYFHHKYKEIPKLPRFDMQIYGFFQSGKYFEDFSEEIRQLYVFPSEALSKAKDFLSKDSRPTVGIHIRLGDYKMHSYLAAFSEDYYSKAVSHFSKDFRFIVCSDEPSRAAELLQAVHVEFFTGDSDVADLALLSLCDNLIMSNSTFSYWAYYLGKKKNTVIAPLRWFNQNVVDNHHDIYEEDWIRI